MDNTLGSPRINLSLDQTSEVLCESCSNKYFTQGLYIRKASGVLTGSPNPSYIPIPVFLCTKCNHVNDEFLPVEIKNNKL